MMSVEVKTPTRTQFEHSEFPCGDRNVSGYEQLASVSGSEHHSTSNTSRHEEGGVSSGNCNIASSRFYRKRKMSERGGNQHPYPNRKRHGFKIGKSGEKIVLPSKFLLGGNITDPLNLNALCDDEIGRALNEKTPQSSPLPVPDYKNQVQVLIPPNINDPLNLNAVADADVGLVSPKYGSKKKKHKHKRKRTTSGPLELSESETVPQTTENSDTSKDVNLIDTVEHTTSIQKDKVEDVDDNISKTIDKIVSPAVPQPSAKAKKCNKRLSSECSKTEIDLSRSTEKQTRQETNFSSPKPRAKKQLSDTSFSEQNQSKKSHKKDRFMYGNYNRYYGYRNPGTNEDIRLEYFRSEWFHGKDVLDIGCNIGHVTLSIARDSEPRKIVGMDIDSKLVSIAKKNVRHYMTEDVLDSRKFPVSLPLIYGPISAPAAPSSKPIFPHNVMFVQGNYVLDKDDELELVQEEYDAILALSITKWIHLNFGDSGLKRMFKRMFKQLRPGGKLILEPQAWASYTKKKKITEKIHKNYQTIRLRPEQFTEYLLSREVGFVACEHLETPVNKSKGFQRPIHVYMKAESGSTPVEGVTPLMEINCTPGTNTPYKDTPHGATPKLEAGSSIVTPCSSCQNTPTYLHGTWSASGTPRNDSDTGGWGTPGRMDHEVSKTPPGASHQDNSNSTDNG